MKSPVTIDDVYREGDNAGEFLGDAGDAAGKVGTAIVQGMFSTNGNGQAAGQQGGAGEPGPDADDEAGEPPTEVAGAFIQGGNGIRVPDVTRSVRRTLRNRLPW